MGLKVIITGATGMVGEGVLLVCLSHPHIEKVLTVNRKPVGISHPKLKELIVEDFEDINLHEKDLVGYETCFYCLGISSVGVSPEDYFKTTYTLTMEFAKTISKLNKDMTFCYVSGVGTDSSEKGHISWARVKVKTENDLLKLPFKKAFGMRPGYIKPYPKQKNAHSYYKYLGWLYPIGRSMAPNNFCTMEDLALCMISLAKSGYYKSVINGRDILEISSHQSR